MIVADMVLELGFIYEAKRAVVAVDHCLVQGFKENEMNLYFLKNDTPAR